MSNKYEKSPSCLHSPADILKLLYYGSKPKDIQFDI